MSNPESHSANLAQEGLFREKALRRRMNPWLGGVNLVQPPAMIMLAWIFFLGALAVVVFVLAVAFSTRVRVSGTIVPATGVISVAAPVAGVVTRAQLEEGQSVVRGQILAHVSSALSYDGGDVASASVESISSIRSEIEKAVAATRDRYVSDLRSNRAKLASVQSDRILLKEAVSRSERQVELASDSLDRLNRLKVEQLVSIIDANRYENEYLQKKSDLDDARRRMADIDRSTFDLVGEANLIETAFRNASADLNVRMFELSGNDAASRASRSAIIKASADGLIATVLIKEGQAVRQSDQIATLVSLESPLQVELMVSSRAIGHVNVGDSLSIEYDAFPYQKFGRHSGSVERISLASIPGQATDNYRVVVALMRSDFSVEGKIYKLKPGMVAHSYVSLEEQSLASRVAAPFIDIIDSLQ